MSRSSRVDGFDGAALALLNDSRYGLAAAVFTDAACERGTSSHGGDAGQVAVNLPTSGWDVHMPFGGFGASGSGHQGAGRRGARFYRQDEDRRDRVVSDGRAYAVEIPTRWLDTDAYGHVNNVQYYSYFDTAVTTWLDPPRPASTPAADRGDRACVG